MDEITQQPVALISPPTSPGIVEVKPPTDIVDNSRENIPVEREVAYTIDDKYFSGFEVVKTSYGWWKEKSRVVSFINCFKQGYNIKQACIFTGISKQQWELFYQLHPLIYSVIESCQEVGKMMVESNIHAFIQEKDKETTRWYAERRIKEKYGKSSDEGPGNTVNNFGTIINQPASNVPPVIMERLRAKGLIK